MNQPKNYQTPEVLPANDKALNVAALLLDRGGIAGIPTETVYGLAADATNGEAVASIYAAKGRPQFNPLISHVDSIDMARRYARFDARAEQLAQLFWPGSLTLVLPKQQNCEVSELVTAGLDTIALRCPNNDFTQKLISKLGRPLAAPSANPSGQLSPTSALAVRDVFSRQELPLVVNGGTCSVGLESTIVSCVPGSPLSILRPGAITLEDLQGIFGDDVQVHVATSHDQSQPAAPGMLLSHYAPNAKLVFASVGDEIGYGRTLLTFSGVKLAKESQDNLVAQMDLSPSGDIKEAASNLFSMLRELDANAPEIIHVIPPLQVGLGVAIHDRLQRAAAPRIND
ncbi:MAG: L-threonylcarbamoyladenylate synthase [Hyphomicrobiales bacterium]